MRVRANSAGSAVSDGGKEHFGRFCLPASAQEDLGKPGIKGKAEIVIKNLVLTSAYEGCQNAAELVRVQSKVITPGSSS
jgi:hypothetical protein